MSKTAGAYDRLAQRLADTLILFHQQGQMTRSQLTNKFVASGRTIFSVFSRCSHIIEHLGEESYHLAHQYHQSHRTRDIRQLLDIADVSSVFTGQKVAFWSTLLHTKGLPQFTVKMLGAIEQDIPKGFLLSCISWSDISKNTFASQAHIHQYIDEEDDVWFRLHKFLVHLHVPATIAGYLLPLSVLPVQTIETHHPDGSLDVIYRIADEASASASRVLLVIPSASAFSRVSSTDIEYLVTKRADIVFLPPDRAQ